MESMEHKVGRDASLHLGNFLQTVGRNDKGDVGKISVSVNGKKTHMKV